MIHTFQLVIVCRRRKPRNPPWGNHIQVRLDLETFPAHNIPQSLSGFPIETKETNFMESANYLTKFSLAKLILVLLLPKQEKNLTAYRKMLLNEAVKAKKLLNFKFIWTSQGRIRLRKDSESRIINVNLLSNLSKIGYSDPDIGQKMHWISILFL